MEPEKKMKKEQGAQKNEKGTVEEVKRRKGQKVERGREQGRTL